jgi:ribosomal protein S18 acetylase RimI-like enzyme
MATGKSSNGGAPDFLVRDVRRHERDAFLSLCVANAGAMDRELGLLDNAHRDLSFVFGSGTWFLLRLLRLFGKAPVRLMVAEADGRLVGTTITILSGPWTYVAAVGVSSSHRRLGIARALVTRAEEIGRATKKPWLVLDVDADNTPARKLYAARGLSSGLRTAWWRLPSISPVPLETPSEKITVRTATAADISSARSCSAASLSIPLPPRCVHPLELVCQNSRSATENWATGPEGDPTYLVRVYVPRPSSPSFILCVPGKSPSTPEATAVIARVREYLKDSGAKDIFAPIRETDSTTTRALESLRSARLVISETMWKSIR